MEVMERFRRARDLFDGTVEAVPASSRDRPAARERWTVRHVGRVVPGQEQPGRWATGEPHAQPDGPPGSAHPGVLADEDPAESRLGRAPWQPVAA